MNGPKTERVELPYICPACLVRMAEERCHRCGGKTVMVSADEVRRIQEDEERKEEGEWVLKAIFDSEERQWKEELTETEEEMKAGKVKPVDKSNSDPMTYDGSGIPGGRNGMTAQEIMNLVAVNEKKEEADSAHVYTFRNQYISRRMMVPIRAYINHGMRPGPFLEAVICNDLLNAFGQADEENYPNIHAFIGYFYNEAPGNCWGSKEKMEAWIEKKLAERREKNNE